MGLDILVTAIVIASDLWRADVLKAIRAGTTSADPSIISAVAFWDTQVVEVSFLERKLAIVSLGNVKNATQAGALNAAFHMEKLKSSGW